MRPGIRINAVRAHRWVRFLRLRDGTLSSTIGGMNIGLGLSRLGGAVIRPGIGRAVWGSPRYETIVDNGDPARRLDVAILGDGYTAAEMPLFRADVDAIVAEFRAVEPIRSYWQHFNFHRVNLITPTPGTNDCYQKPAVRTTTPLGTHFSFIDKRRLVGWDWRVWQVAVRSGVPFDVLLVVVNTPRRGGATRFWLTVGYASRNSADFPRIMVHEAGHAIAKLNDEYVDRLAPSFKWLRGLRRLPNLLPFANVTTNPKRPPWRDWLADHDDDNGVGCHEGGSFVSYGVYRPTTNCMMREHNQPFCPVCQEQWIKRIYRRSVIADGGVPDSDLFVQVGERFVLEAAVLRRDHIETVWSTRNQAAVWTEVQRSPAYMPLAWRFDQPGRSIIRCDLADRSPRIRKQSVVRQSAQRLEWAVIVR